jgi:hypothetical protein
LLAAHIKCAATVTTAHLQVVRILDVAFGALVLFTFEVYAVLFRFAKQVFGRLFVRGRCIREVIDETFPAIIPVVTTAFFSIVEHCETVCIALAFSHPITRVYLSRTSVALAFSEALGAIANVRLDCVTRCRAAANPANAGSMFP